MRSPSGYSAAAAHADVGRDTGVPASNFQGISFHSARRRWTSRIMSAAGEEGGIDSTARAVAPQRARPVGPASCGR